ncbi:helix-turn-helix domain-containing protein [Bacillus sp. UNC438CL73TsuS30]|uniref:helix-turn-helix domain-containing protein n=1 Tax=Bacillus sp. UNC438CL73TsuS30 TaxID=1340434 RepID=UPI00047DED70|nr:helix-turn-helix domain-containing protein [Bacillus sp. UNC438CL73TsuS30]
MTASIILTSEQFTYMQAYKPAASNRKEQAAIKCELMDAVKGALGDLYSRLKQGTKDALDKLAFLATDRGFAFISYNSLSKELEVSRRTIERVIKQLREKGVLAIIYRRNPKGNSVKNPVVMFTAHKYFSHWSEFLELATPTCVVENDVLHDVEENAETACDTKYDDVKKDATINLPCITSLKDFNNRKVDELEQLEKEYVFQDIPQAVQMRLSAFEGKQVNAIWTRIIWAYRNSDIDAKATMTLQQLCRINDEIERRLCHKLAGCILKYKRGAIKGSLYGYLYKSSLNFFNDIQNEKYEDTILDVNTNFEERFFNIVQARIEDRKVVRWGCGNFESYLIKRKSCADYEELPF